MANLTITKLFQNENDGVFIQERLDLRGGEIVIRAIEDSSIYFLVSLGNPQQCMCKLGEEAPFYPGTDKTFFIKPGKEISISGFINFIMSTCSPTGKAGYKIT